MRPRSMIEREFDVLAIKHPNKLDERFGLILEVALDIREQREEAVEGEKPIGKTVGECICDSFYSMSTESVAKLKAGALQAIFNHGIPGRGKTSVPFIRTYRGTETTDSTKPHWTFNKPPTGGQCW